MRTLALILVGAAVILVLTVGVGLLPRLLDPFDAAEIADLPFKTSFKVQAGNHVPLDGEFVSTLYGVWALSRAYGSHGAGIIDFGDIRVVIRGWGVSGLATGGVFVDTNREDGGRMGSGAGFFSSYHEAGVTTCTSKHVDYPDITFEVVHMKMLIAGVTVPIGQGHRVVYLSPMGDLEEVRILDEQPATIDRTLGGTIIFSSK